MSKLRTALGVAGSVLFAPVALLILVGICVQLMLSRDARREYEHDMNGKEEG